jgi:hypothetical protein
MTMSLCFVISKLLEQDLDLGDPTNAKNQRCGSGSGFNGVPGSVSGSGFAIRIQEGKNDSKT